MHNVVEEWRDVIGYEGIYQVSSLGRVKSLSRVAKNRHGYRPIKERILKPAYRDGYVGVGLRKNTKPTTFLVHRLVAEAFIPNPGGKPCIDHINMIRSDNRVENLEWVTYSENSIRAVNILGSHSLRGSDNSKSVLTNDKVLTISALLDEGELLQKEIADMYGVSSTVISNIYRGLAWNWLTGRKSAPGGHYGKSK